MRVFNISDLATLVASEDNKPPSVLNVSACREREPLGGRRITCREHWPSMPSNPEDRPLSRFEAAVG